MPDITGNGGVSVGFAKGLVSPESIGEVGKTADSRQVSCLLDIEPQIVKDDSLSLTDDNKMVLVDRDIGQVETVPALLVSPENDTETEALYVQINDETGEVRLFDSDPENVELLSEYQMSETSTRYDAALKSIQTHEKQARLGSEEILKNTDASKRSLAQTRAYEERAQASSTETQKHEDTSSQSLAATQANEQRFAGQ